MPTLRRFHGSAGGQGKDTSPADGGFGMHACSLGPSGNRNRSRGRKWLSRALVRTLRRRLKGSTTACLTGLLILVGPLSGSTHITEYFPNGFKARPNYW